MMKQSIPCPHSIGRVFAMSAPAGTGKTTLVEMLESRFENVARSTTFTTRVPRADEQHGDHYHFISVEEFEKKILAGDFLEYVKLFQAYYGTCKRDVKKLCSQGKFVILVIDTQGALQLKKMINASLIFLSPPSIEELRDRLEKRQTETPERIEERLAIAQDEINKIPYYDYHVINHDLEEACKVVESILTAEAHKVDQELLWLES